MNNFTNKPWHVVEGRTYGSIEVFSGETAIAEMWRRGDKSSELANAQLIASAPELLEALKYCRNKIAYMQEHGEWYSPERAIEKADAAIAKAGGKA